tara:strand:- start:8412 stop:9431 length:1020 start_codon:yes stop_codon:yes gene_type:complete
MSNYFIGIMTGTSADAIDGCIVSFENEFNLIAYDSIFHEESYKEDYEKCIAQGLKTIDQSKTLMRLENHLNTKTLELINKILSKNNLTYKDIFSIGFSGQTVFHTYEKSYQIGDPQFLSKNSKIKVISDFRNFDIQNGGMGAPLVPIFHEYLYAEENKNKIIFNIGGIANGTYLDGKRISLASDVGPGNCLMDYISAKSFGVPYDRNGDFAKKGKLSSVLYKKLIKECSNMEYPRADDKNDYYKLIDNTLLKMSPEDALNTLANFTVQKIKDFYDFCGEPEEIIFHGGGVKNLFLMKLLKENIKQEIRTTDNEIPSESVEAAAFAYLAYMNKGETFDVK